MVRNRVSSAWCVATTIVLLACASQARGGGGPENVFLVVNSASWASQTVANHFIHLRRIPALNVFYTDWTGGFESVDGNTLRDKIMRPPLETIDKRGLHQQIDYFIYSSDFPYSVDLTEDFAQRIKLPAYATPSCSLSSATFFWNLLFVKSPVMMDAHANHYMRLAVQGNTDLPTQGFRSWYGWNTRGDVSEAGGQPYMLSSLLAVTSGRGNSVREAISYLERSAAADGSRPTGTIYFSKTKDIRSERRAGEFAAAIEQLKLLGVKGEVITSPLPIGKPDVAGAMIGVPEYSWPQSRSTILPGAICENFTSFGGIFVEGFAQTPLSEFLRYGAAGSSGTVVEPTAMPEKFPAPKMHVHYARGCTLAEAFYQSVFAPAQLLLVGDPLCRPWAEIPAVTAGGVKANGKVSGTIVIKPEARLKNDGAIDTFQLFVDGRQMGSCPPGGSISWNSASDSDGYHELRVVAIEASPIETQGRAIVPVTVDNRGHSVELSSRPAGKVRWDESLTVHVKAPGMKQIYVLHNSRSLGTIAGEEGDLKINPRNLGLGPIQLQALAVQAADSRERAQSAPLALVIEPNKPLPALKDPPAKLAAGLVVKLEKDQVVPVQETRDPAWLANAGVEQEKTFTAQAYFDVPTDDVYQFQLWHFGDLKLTVDGAVLYDGKRGDYSEKFVPTALAAGKHRLTFGGRAGSDLRMRILFGGPGSLSLNGKSFKHQSR